MLVTHERLSLEPYQTWQYCEVADIEPFQGQSDQIFQFSIIQNRVRIPFYLHANRKGCRREGPDSLSLSSRLSQGRRTEKENVRNPSVSSRFADRGPERARARQHKEVCKRKRKNRNLWTRLSERCPPSWSRLTTGVDQRNFAITLLPSSLFPIYLSIYLSRSLSLFFFYRSLSPPSLSPTCSFCPVSSRFAFFYSSFTLSSHRNYNSLFSFYIYI